MKRLPSRIILGTALVKNAKGQQENALITLHESDGGEAAPMREVGNLVAIAPPGGGKTRLIETQLLNWGYSVMVIDLKGGLYASTANYRRTLGDVVVLDPRDGRGSRYNPLALLKVKQRRQLAITLASRGEEVGGSDRFWVNSAAEFWLACWFAADQAKKAHIPYAVELIQLGIVGALRYLHHYHHNNAPCMRRLRGFIGTDVTDAYIERLEEEGASKLLDSKWATVIESAAPFDDVNMLNLFNGHEIDVPSMFKKPTTVYIMADETDQESFGAFSRLTMKTLGDALINVGDKLSFNQRYPILFMFDEFGTVRLNNVRTWLNTMRSRGVILWIFAQSLAQLPSETKRDFEASKENSIHHWCVYAPIFGEGETGNLIGQLSGMTTVRVFSGDSTSGKITDTALDQNRSTSYAMQERPNVRPEDVDRWLMSEAAVSVRPNGGKREFYRCTMANPDRLGLERPTPAEPLPRLSAYVSPLFPLPEPPQATEPGRDEDNGRGRSRTKTKRRAILDGFDQDEDDDPAEWDDDNR